MVEVPPTQKMKQFLVDMTNYVFELTCIAVRICTKNKGACSFVNFASIFLKYYNS